MIDQIKHRAPEREEFSIQIDSDLHEENEDKKLIFQDFNQI